MTDSVINRRMGYLFRITEIEHFQPDRIGIISLVNELQVHQGLDAVEVHRARFQNRSVRRKQGGHRP